MLLDLPDKRMTAIVKIVDLLNYNLLHCCFIFRSLFLHWLQHISIFFSQKSYDPCRSAFQFFRDRLDLSGWYGRSAICNKIRDARFFHMIQEYEMLCQSIQTQVALLLCQSALENSYFTKCGSNFSRKLHWSIKGTDYVHMLLK